MNDNTKETILWERQPGESAKAYNFFCRYRDMGYERSYAKVAREVGKAHITIAKMANRWNWVKRVQAHIDEMEKVRYQLETKAIADMVRRHSEHAQAIETSLMLPIKIFINKMKNEELRELNNMNTAELMKLVFNVADRFPNIVNTERKSRGVPTEISKQNIDHTTNGKSINITAWETLKSDMLKNLSEHPEAKNTLLKVLDKYVDTGETN